MIRKEGKARWTYTCTLCRKKWTYPDQFRAIERQQGHERSLDHMLTGIGQAFEPLMDSFRQLGLAWAPAANSLEAMASALADTNRPHDPALLRDRRKWGGR